MATQPLSRGLKVEFLQACFGSSRFVSSGQETEKFCWTILGECWWVNGSCNRLKWFFVKSSKFSSILTRFRRVGSGKSFIKKFVKSLGTSWLKLKLVVRFEADQKLFREINGTFVSKTRILGCVSILTTRCKSYLLFGMQIWCLVSGMKLGRLMA